MTDRIREITRPSRVSFLLAFLFIVIMTMSAAASQDPSTCIVSIEASSMDAKLVLNELANMAGADIVIDDTITSRVSAKLTDVPFGKAIEIIARTIGAEVSIEGDFYVITNTRGLYYSPQQAQEQTAIQIVNLSGIGTEIGMRLISALSKDLMVEELPELRSVVISGSYSKVQAVKTAVDAYLRETATGTTAETALQIVRLMYADSSEAAMALQSQFGTIRVTSLRTDNALLISGPPEKVKAASELIKQLDAKPKQLRIDVEIIEASSEDIDAYGIDWGNTYGGTTLSLSLRELDMQFDPTKGILENLIGIKPMTRSSIQIALYARALVAEGKASVIARPSLLALENRTARVTTGDRYTLTIDQNGSSWQQTTYIDSGVSMEITARVDAEGSIIATITPKVNSMTGYTANGMPIIGTREVRTTVRLSDGETTALGGLIKEDSFESENGLPILSEIPLIGKLFSTTKRQERKTELIILLTVTIIP